MRRTRLAAKSPSQHHRTTLSGHIFATKACIDNRKKNLLSSNTSYTCPDNMVNFGPLTAEIGSGVWGTPTNFNGFASWQRYCTASSSGRQPNFAALNRGRHLCSAGRPSGWALAHILVLQVLVLAQSQNLYIIVLALSWTSVSRLGSVWWLSLSVRDNECLFCAFCLYFLSACNISCCWTYLQWQWIACLLVSSMD